MIFCQLLYLRDVMLKLLTYIAPIFQVTYKWLSKNLGIHVNTAKQ